MKKEHRNRFCFKKTGWILAITAVLSLYTGSVFAEENTEVENVSSQSIKEESLTPVPKESGIIEEAESKVQQPQENPKEEDATGAAEEPVKDEQTATVEKPKETKEEKVQESVETFAPTPTPVPTEAVAPTEMPEAEPADQEKALEKQEESVPVEETTVSANPVETNGSAQIISVDITWESMEFVYKNGPWNPETHQYGTGNWKPDGDGSNQISISNNGTESIKASLAYTQADTSYSYSGSFQNGNGENISEITVPKGEKASAYLDLTGTPTEELSNSVLGTVTVTIERQ